MTTAQQIIARAALFGLTTKLWEKGDKCRLYLSFRKDINAYLEIEGTSANVEGAALKVFCTTAQHPNWVRSQVAQYSEIAKPLFFAYVIEHYADTPPEPNGYGHDINAMIEEARAFEAARLANASEEDAEG